jgi:hypothetical protein
MKPAQVASKQMTWNLALSAWVGSADYHQPGSAIISMVHYLIRLELVH